MSHSSIHYNISALPCRMCPQVVELFYNITKLKTHKNPFLLYTNKEKHYLYRK